MTEQEYMDVSDLQIFRAAHAALYLVNAFDMPNKSRCLSIKENLSLCIKSLEEKLDGSFDDEEEL